MRDDPNSIKRRIFDILQGQPFGRITADEIRERMPDLCSRQMTNAVNKLVNEGVVTRIAAFGEQSKKYIVLKSHLKDIGEVFEVRQPHAELASAFGIAPNLNLNLRKRSRSGPRILKEDGLLVHRAIFFNDPD